MPRIEETQLPGVGIRHDFMTRSGARVGVVSHRSGRRELLIYAESDPDACSEVLRLEEDEGHALADLLGGTTVTEHLQSIQQEVEGITIDWLRIHHGSQAAGSAIEEVGRQRTGVSIVAVIRGNETIPSPGMDVVLEDRDTAVVVGSAESVAAFAALTRA